MEEKIETNNQTSSKKERFLIVGEYKIDLTKWIDINEIKKQVSIKKILEFYGIAPVRKIKDDQYIALSPFSDDKNKPSLSYNIMMNAFYCFESKTKGNIFDFVMAMNPEIKDLRTAGLFIDQIIKNHNEIKQVDNLGGETYNKLDGIFNANKKPDKIEKPKENSILNLDLSDKIKKDHPFLIKEKQFKPETIEYFNIGYIGQGSMKTRIIYPIHNIKGELIAYTGRATRLQEIQTGFKWKFPTNFHKDIEVYNLHRFYLDEKLHNNVKETGLIITQGINDVVYLKDRAGIEAVSIMGTEITEEQKRKILEITDKLIFFFDESENGYILLKKCLSLFLKDAFIKPTFND